MIRYLEPVVTCPACRGSGQEYSTLHKTLVWCPTCSGRRWVIAQACRGCGRPASKYWPPNQIPLIVYCGLEACLTNLVHIHALPEKRKKISLVQAAEIAQALERAEKRVDVMDELRKRIASRPGPSCRIETRGVR